MRTRVAVLIWLAAALAPAPALAASNDDPLAPIDPQNWQNQYDMTWEDWRDIPGTRWNDPDAEPSVRGLRIALVAVDFPDQPFVITQPKRSDPFGNPQIDPIAHEDVPRFYRDYYMEPSEINRGRTIHEYWMEQSRGKLGVSEMDAFGPYRMPRNLFEYGLDEFGQEPACPSGFDCDGNSLNNDAANAWRADQGCTGTCGYDVILRVYAGYDETSIWQEFGEMMFQRKEDIPDAWGPPDPNLPNWAPTRYVEWTSWKAAAQHWGQASIRQGESSGTITHEMAHFFFSIGDNNNNPFTDRANPPQPFHRVGSAPWDMMDRGSFNGPGGHHMRWVVPPNMGGWSPAGLLLRNKIHMNFLPESNILRLNREALDESGVVVDEVTARAVDPGPSGNSGIRITLDGTPADRTPPCDVNTDPFCHGSSGWNHYTMEVADRMGFDSFLPDHGVVIAKNKTGEGNTCGYNCFNWVIDANPQDIGMVDFYRPDGTPVMATIADHRQLNDAAFHAGTDSGSEYEWVDEHNRLHFYVVDIERDADGVLSYTLAVRSLDGDGPHARGVDLERPSKRGVAPGRAATCTFPLENTGTTAPVSAAHPEDVSAVVRSDVYRLSATSSDARWEVRLPNALAAAEAGDTVAVPVHVVRRPRSAPRTQVTLRAVSESDRSAAATATCDVHVRDTVRGAGDR